MIIKVCDIGASLSDFFSLYILEIAVSQYAIFFLEQLSPRLNPGGKGDGFIIN